MDANSQLKQQFEKMMNFRHACKVFDESRKIPDDDFQYILQSARLSPSSFGFEPWHFLVVQDPALREKLQVHTWGAQGTLPTASHFSSFMYFNNVSRLGSRSPISPNWRRDIRPG